MGKDLYGNKYYENLEEELPCKKGYCGSAKWFKLRRE